VLVYTLLTAFICRMLHLQMFEICRIKVQRNKFLMFKSFSLLNLLITHNYRFIDEYKLTCQSLYTMTSLVTNLNNTHQSGTFTVDSM